MKRSLLLFFCCLILAIAVSAQTAPKAPATPLKPAAEGEKITITPTQIIDKYIQAVGGKAAIEKVSTRIAKGTFEIGAVGISAPAEIYAKAPNSVLISINVPGFGAINSAFNGSAGWAQDPQSGMRDITGKELAALKRQSDFHRDLHFKDLYPTSTVTGKAKVGDRDTYLIEAKAEDGTVEKFYFDVENGLLLRSETEQETQQGKIPVQILYEDYREVDGVKMPFITRQALANASIVIKLTEVKQNVPIDDAKFNKPGAATK